MSAFLETVQNGMKEQGMDFNAHERQRKIMNAEEESRREAILKTISCR